MKVLIAVDESEYATAIGHFVAHDQWCPDAKFVVLSAVESLKVGNLMAVLPGPILDEIFEAKWKIAQKVVSATASSIRDAFMTATVQEEIIEGHPAETILQFSRDWDADLIVMGSHGRTGLNKLMLGSVSLAVVSHAPCSVVIVRLKVSADNLTQQ
jgi:nucleotide-binding universal stress UspA family protein